MRVVIDASVIVKWLVDNPGGEPDWPAALRLLNGIRARKLQPIQPPHWLAEVAAVITRLAPAKAERSIALLDAMELQTADSLNVYQRASRLAQELDHHLFDTLYHAVALEHVCLLVSADDKYVRKARRLGCISSLEAWEGGTSVHEP